jgi:hypothetical protein
VDQDREAVDDHLRQVASQLTTEPEPQHALRPPRTTVLAPVGDGSAGFRTRDQNDERRVPEVLFELLDGRYVLGR